MDKQNRIDSRRLSQSLREAIGANNGLSEDERIARNKYFLESHAVTEIEGWLWDICWGKAKEYYEKD